jgi:hypothetical protein
MTELAAILADAGVTKALIVDDAFDEIPTAADISIDGEQWTHFFDDLAAADTAALEAAFPGYTDFDAGDLQKSDPFVRCLWKNDHIAPLLRKALFQRYQADMAADKAHLSALSLLLKGAGLTVKTTGRQFIADVANADIVFMDLFLCSAQRPDDIKESISGLAQAVAQRRSNPPLVVLISRSTRLEDKREEFREGTRLFESTFRILVKSDIQIDGVVQRTIGRLAVHYQKSLKLSEFVCAWEDGLDSAKDRTTKLIRKLGLSDLAQIDHLLLSAEGEPMGSYLVDVFDKVLQHEIEANTNIIDTALALNQLDSTLFPAPLIPGANDLLELVEHSLFHNRARLKLPGATDSSVSFGDVLRRKPGALADAHAGILPEITDSLVMAVLSPACDLQRNQLKRVLLLVGELVPLKIETWNARIDGAKTPVFDLGDGLRRWIRWDVKHVHTLTHAELSAMLDSANPVFEKVARLRDLHALELQQKLLASMGRVGLAAPMPATHAVRIEAFTVGDDKKLKNLNIASLADGGVCFIGRTDDGEKPLEKLVLTERACEDICRAIDQVDIETVHDKSRDILKELQQSQVLLQTLESGITISGASSDRFVEFKSRDNKIQGLIARNRRQTDTLILSSKELTSSGIVLIAYDAAADEAIAAAEQAAAETAKAAEEAEPLGELVMPAIPQAAD